MLINCFVIWMISIQSGLLSIKCDPIYTIIAPSIVRPNSDYHVNLFVENSSEPIDFEISISGPSTQSNFNRVVQNVLVRPHESRIANLEIGEWSKGNYKLIVKGVSKENPRMKIENETNLEFDQKSNSIFIQTDKAIYKPGQTVRFRAIIVNPSLIPNVPGSLDIYIKDPKENLIKQWRRIFTTRGVVAEEFALSDQPPLGDWSIEIEVTGQKEIKTFTVAEYQLPTFSVEIILPPYSTYNKSDVIAIVKAMYTYGKPLKGDVALTVQPRIRHSSITFRPLEQFQTKVKLDSDGKVAIPINIVRDLNLKTDFFEREIEFFALVEETLTGRKYNKSSVMKIFHKEIKIELIKTSNTFKPGLKYIFFLKVAYQDDTPVDDDGPPVQIRYGFSYNDENWTNIIEKIPYKGLIQIELYPPRSDEIFIIGLRASYRGQTYYLESINCAQSPSNNFIQITHSTESNNDDSLLRKSFQVGEELSFDVQATEPFDDLVYQVMAKGDIVFSQNVHLESQTSTKISLITTHKMTPRSRIIVYYIRKENSEIVADALSFEVDGVFKTPVQIKSNVNQTKPGAPVSIEILTKPMAYVGLLGVDQSLLLLKQGFDITTDDVLTELNSYDSGKKIEKNSIDWFWKTSWHKADGLTASELFENCGVVILTNGLVHRHINAIYLFESDMLLMNRRFSPLMSSESVPLSSSFAKESLSLYSKSSRKPKSIPRLRKNFPETWIWTNLSAESNGIATYSDSIPDTITSWYISAFAIDSITGLGVAEKPTKINVFRPFFIKLSLPDTIIRGEYVIIQAVVFNYQKKAVEAEVSMLNEDGEFEFTTDSNEIEFGNQNELREKNKKVIIAPFDGVSIPFLITPKKLGYITIHVRAKTDNAGDAVSKKLLVKPEGRTQFFNKAMFVNTISRGTEQNSFPRNISIDVAENAVAGSTRITVSGISDILGSTVNHLEDLLRMPYGCGEQNMINLVPNIVVWNYLERINRLNEAIKEKMKRHIETGYQRELTYRRDDGSFSAFGNADKAGSTWLTAFVVKTFLQARAYIDVDAQILSKSIEWLFSRQRKDGSFAEYGEVHNKALQGGSAIQAKHDNFSETSNNLGALTSFVLIAIAQESKNNPLRARNEFALQRATDYIYSRIASSNNPYEVAIGTYALHVYDSPHKDFAYKKLMSMMRKDEDDLVYWSINPDTRNKARDRLVKQASDYLLFPDAIDIESTSYALLTLMERSEIDSALPALRWLISKQNSNGGFSSTQDTVIALQALGAIAERISTATIKLNVEIRHGNSRTSKNKENRQNLYFNNENALVLQQIELEPETEWVHIEPEGFGTAIIQVSYQYNLAVSAEKPAFFLNPQKDKTSTENYLQLSICTYYKDGNSTNMAVMEVELPSGYNADLEALPAITRAKVVKRVETSNNDETVFVYLDRVTRDEVCITVPAHRTHHVANNKPVPVTIYDYYDRSKLSRIFYEPELVTFCDICPQEEIACKTRCSRNKHQRLLSNRFDGSVIENSSNEKLKEESNSSSTSNDSKYLETFLIICFGFYLIPRLNY
ncbi:Antigen -like protein [Sarcoptes scabiei]|nr:Antigen -like protein [Sarcoptes scabiei]